MGNDIAAGAQDPLAAMLARFGARHQSRKDKDSGWKREGRRAGGCYAAFVAAARFGRNWREISSSDFGGLNR